MDGTGIPCRQLEESGFRSRSFPAAVNGIWTLERELVSAENESREFSAAGWLPDRDVCVKTTMDAACETVFPVPERNGTGRSKFRRRENTGDKLKKII